MSKYSQSFYEYTSTYELETGLLNMLTGGSIRISVEFTTEEDKYLREFSIPITRAHSDEIKMIMENNCKTLKINREMFLENLPMVAWGDQVFVFNNNQNMTELDEPSVLKNIYKKWSLGIECSYCSGGIT